MFTDLRLRRVALMLMTLVMIVAGCGKDNGTEPPDPPDDGLTGEDLGDGWRWYNEENSPLPWWTVTAIAIDQQGRKWIGTEGKGVALFDDRTDEWTLYTNNDYPFGFINDIHIDPDGIVWVGDFYTGLHKFDGTEWTRINNEPGNRVTAITTDNDGYLWIGTEEWGVAKYDGHTWAVYDTTNSGIPENRIRCLAVDNDNVLWIGTAYNGMTWNVAGLASFDGEEWKIYNEQNSMLSEKKTVSCIAVDSENRKWIGAGTLYIYDDHDWMRAYPPQSFDNFFTPIKTIAITREDNVWFGVHVGGFAGFDGNDWIPYYPLDHGVSSGLVLTLTYEDNADKIWVGFHGGGFVSIEIVN